MPRSSCWTTVPSSGASGVVVTIPISASSSLTPRLTDPLSVSLISSLTSGCNLAKVAIRSGSKVTVAEGTVTMRTVPAVEDT